MTTLREVARASGVSISTASRALSDHEYVRSTTRAKVVEAARELGYAVNPVARGLRRNRTRTVGLVMPDMRNSSFSSEAAPYLQRQLQDYGYGLVIYVTRNDREVELRCLERLRDQEVDGVIHVPATASSADFLTEGPRPIPVVELFRKSTSEHFDAVTYDSTSAAATLTSHLLELGHCEIGIITGVERLESTRRRVAGAYRAVEEADLPPSCVHVAHAEHSPQAGKLAFRRLLRQYPQITAVLATSTQFVLGGALAARELGMAIPEDVSLAGFGDPEWGQLMTPAITTFTLPVEEMAMTAALLVSSRIDRPPVSETPPTRIVFSGTLIARGSTSSPSRT
jgi:LacI family transcriptional regulator